MQVWCTLLALFQSPFESLFDSNYSCMHSHNDIIIKALLCSLLKHWSLQRRIYCKYQIRITICLLKVLPESRYWYLEMVLMPIKLLSSLWYDISVQKDIHDWEDALCLNKSKTFLKAIFICIKPVLLYNYDI